MVRKDTYDYVPHGSIDGNILTSPRFFLDISTIGAMAWRLMEMQIQEISQCWNGKMAYHSVITVGMVRDQK